MRRDRDVPLLTWGEDLRRHKVLRRRRRRWISGLAALAVTALVSANTHPGPRLLWNVSASVATGLYAVAPGAEPHRGDLAVAWLPPSARTLASTRRYLPFDVPLIKPVAAVAGDTICADGHRISIDGKIVAEARTTDRLGRPLPRWMGCRRLRESELFLLATGRDASFDGRYFGVSRSVDLLGTARLLWVR